MTIIQPSNWLKVYESKDGSAGPTPLDGLVTFSDVRPFNKTETYAIDITYPSNNIPPTMSSSDPLLILDFHYIQLVRLVRQTIYEYLVPSKTINICYLGLEIVDPSKSYDPNIDSPQTIQYSSIIQQGSIPNYTIDIPNPIDTTQIDNRIEREVWQINFKNTTASDFSTIDDNQGNINLGKLRNNIHTIIRSYWKNKVSQIVASSHIHMLKRINIIVTIQ